MAKRKRYKDTSNYPRKALQSVARSEIPSIEYVNIQIITGSYERVLHGMTATISRASEAGQPPYTIQFSDTFLFHAHASAIRCLALGPLPSLDSSQSHNILLASGGTDERINLYNLSASSPIGNETFPSIKTLAGNKILENPKNRQLGSLLHHSSSISALYFPTRSKLIAGAEDNTISVTRTRDWSVVSTIKVPRPKAQQRPSGDTSPPGAAPAGVNDFAVHPSMKLMLSVGKGERCMRLWNLVTGKKAGVLNFGKEILEAVEESKRSSGEGRKVTWDSQGQEFAVAFERGIIVFGIDSRPRCRVVPTPVTKLHHIKYVKIEPSHKGKDEILAVSTEDGRLLFYSTNDHLSDLPDGAPESSIPVAQLRGQLSSGQLGRIKDFEILNAQASQGPKEVFLVTCGSDGIIKVWILNQEELISPSRCRQQHPFSKTPEDRTQLVNDVPQAGKVLGEYETGNRITCLKSFIMLESQETALDESEDTTESADQDRTSDSESEA